MDGAESITSDLNLTQLQLDIESYDYLFIIYLHIDLILMQLCDKLKLLREVVKLILIKNVFTKIN
jgi:hypothetical protein